MIEELLKAIAAQGLSGIFLVLALITIFFLYKEAKRERNARLEDMKGVWQDEVKVRAELKALLNLILETLRSKK